MENIDETLNDSLAGSPDSIVDVNEKLNYLGNLMRNGEGVI